MLEDKKAANKLAISASVEATTSPYDIVEGIDECEFFEYTQRKNALGLAFKLCSTSQMYWLYRNLLRNSKSRLCCLYLSPSAGFVFLNTFCSICC